MTLAILKRVDPPAALVLSAAQAARLEPSHLILGAALGCVLARRAGMADDQVRDAVLAVDCMGRMRSRTEGFETGRAARLARMRKSEYCALRRDASRVLRRLLVRAVSTGTELTRRSAD